MLKTVVINRKNHQGSFPKDFVYIGRTAKITGSPNPLSNPYEIGKDGTRKEVIQKFAYDFRVKWRLNPEFRKAVLDCAGKTLVCSCKPDDCHGDVISLFVDTLKETKSEEKAFDAIYHYVIGEFGDDDISNVNSSYFPFNSD